MLSSFHSGEEFQQFPAARRTRTRNSSSGLEGFAFLRPCRPTKVPKNEEKIVSLVTMWSPHIGLRIMPMTTLDSSVGSTCCCCRCSTHICSAPFFFYFVFLPALSLPPSRCLPSSSRLDSAPSLFLSHHPSAEDSRALTQKARARMRFSGLPHRSFSLPSLLFSVFLLSFWPAWWWWKRWWWRWCTFAQLAKLKTFWSVQKSRQGEQHKREDPAGIRKNGFVHLVH